MGLFLLLVSVVYCMVGLSLSQVDPCITNLGLIPNLERRVSGYTLAEDEIELCDQYLVAGWYLLGNYTLSSQAIPCGTVFSWYRTGQLPQTVEEGAIDVDLCMAHGQELCIETMTVELQLCPQNVYAFLATDLWDCPSAYCVEERSDTLSTGIGSPCSTDTDCAQIQGSQCVNNTCMCNNTGVYDNKTRTCNVTTEIESSCSTDTDCAQIQGSHCVNNICMCNNTGVYDNRTRSCNVTTGIGSPCSTDTDCAQTQGSHCVNNTCMCNNTGVYDTHTRTCDVMPLFSYGNSAGDVTLNTEDGCSEALVFPPGIPVDGSKYTNLYVCKNGFITLGSPYNNPNPPRGSFGSGRAVIAPFYTSMRDGNVFYRHIDGTANPSLIFVNDVLFAETLLSRFRGTKEFTTKFALFVTWKNMHPIQSIFIMDKTSTFQLVLLSDGVDTFTFFVYGHGMMTWEAYKSIDVDIWVGISNTGNVVFQHPYSYTTSLLRLDQTTLFKGLNGLIVNWLTRNKVTPHNYAVECFDWYNKNVENKTHFESMTNYLPGCPCSIDVLKNDPHFSHIIKTVGNVSCVDILPDISKGVGGKSCCYDSKSQQWTNEIGRAGGYYTYHPKTHPKEHTLNDQIPKDICCIKSNLCNLYYELRPPGECYKKVPFDIAASWGDPHFLTLDGKQFIFNGLGEYILLDMKNGDVAVTLQARTERAVRKNGELSEATVFVAFAAFDSFNASFHVEVNNDKDGIIIYGNGIDLTNLYKRSDSSNNAFEYDGKNEGLSILKLRKSKERKQNENKTDVEETVELSFHRSNVTFQITPTNGLLALRTMVSNQYRNKTRGLLGNFDEISENDFITPNDEILSPNMTERDIFYYGQLWEIHENNSAFFYQDQTSHNDFQNASFVPRFLDEADPKLVHNASIFCQGMDDIACLFDYVFTENADIAEATRQTAIETEVTMTEISRTIPKVRGCGVLRIDAGLEAECTLSFDENIVQFEFIDNIYSNATYDQTSTTLRYIYFPGNPEDNLRFIVTTADGGKSQVISVPIVLCSGCSGHGECASETDLREDQSSLFQYLRCQCYPQYEGLDCENDFDGCAVSPCSLGRTCEDIPAGSHNSTGPAYTCSPCPDGYLDNGSECIDINECELVNGCEQICINTDGSYICDCDKGFRISYDLQKCLDINECDESLHNCSHLCENIRGGFKCVCHSGYMFEVSSWGCIADSAVTLSCTDIDCSQAEGCTVNSVNESTCFCLDGYVFDRDTNTCVDIDECTIGVCPHDCVNHNGSFQCKCHRGYKLTDVTKCTECDAPFYGDDCGNMCDCSPNGMDRCDPGKGCICRVGWHGPKCEDDVNECENVISSCAEPYTECGNTIGSFICKCIDGYEKSSDSLCVDTDECADPLQNNCSHVCLNTAGGYTCECDEGYTDDGIHCKDIDECELGTSGCDQLCENHQGAFNCYCYFGYRLNDDRQTCKEVENPCESLSNLTCNHYCVVKDASAACQCWPGFSLQEDKQTCADINECEDDDLNTCSDKTSCKNVPGSFLCDCQVGSKLENDGRTCTACDEFHFGKNCSESCHCVNGECDSITGCKCFPGWRGVDCIIDLDECSMANNCTGETVCSNTAGSYACACKSGFKLEEDICHDINECADNSLNTCDQICNNTNGSYDCECYEGYIFDGSMRKCKDIDECYQGLVCDHNCLNTNGHFICSCRQGFKLDLNDRKSCIAKQLCEDEDHCPENSTCVIENKNASCVCNKGFQSSSNTNVTCSDIDECLMEPSLCSQQCHNVKGSFYCFCDTGYRLQQDARTCTACEEGYYGENCNTKCQCVSENTDTCDGTTGECRCLQEWDGDACDMDVNECNTSLNICPLRSQCKNLQGGFLCECDIGFEMTADRQCKECDVNYFGKNCASLCGCREDDTQLSCDNIGGQCLCKPGYGLSLEGNIRCSMCTYNTYGVNCSETCPCNLTNSQQMQQSCDPVVGTCMCNKMWEGSTCNQDLDECSTPNICGTSDDKGCHNIKGGYVCDCRRGYHMVNNSCVKDTQNHTSQVIPKSSERVFLFTHEIIIYVALPTSEDLEVIATYNEVEQNVKDSLYTFHSEFTDANITIFIHDIRRGSLLVNYTVALETREENGDQARADLVAAFVALGNNATIVYDGQNVSTFSDYASDICEVYENAFGKCEADLECVVENGLPECRQTERGVPWNLVIGAAVGGAAFLILLIIFVACIIKIRTSVQRKKMRKGYDTPEPHGPGFAHNFSNSKIWNKTTQKDATTEAAETTATEITEAAETTAAAESAKTTTL
ncbi:uncharacterized protein LOC128227759 isoform X2 [Mya arenaria]|uniref:uncharacterized protein LOC128227759 isoform X2 n=1 Tax=Mya arenaria TaxID=6604 RepID=UPI0022E3EB4C|nr:uncharacterized protein LOC128227759 isoform X2 [Mya arenaria]